MKENPIQQEYLKSVLLSQLLLEANEGLFFTTQYKQQIKHKINSLNKDLEETVRNEYKIIYNTDPETTTNILNSIESYTTTTPMTVGVWYDIKFKFPTNSQSQTVSTISEYLEQTIVEVNKSRDINDIKHFIRYEFLAKDSKEFQKYILDNTPMVLLEYEFVGEDGGAFTAGFQVGTDFFWS